MFDSNLNLNDDALPTNEEDPTISLSEEIDEQLLNDIIEVLAEDQ